MSRTLSLLTAPRRHHSCKNKQIKARSLNPLGVDISGEAKRRLTSSSPRDGVFPWFAPVVLRFTPVTGFSATALRLHRYSYSEERAESFRLVLAGESHRRSSSSE